VRKNEKANRRLFVKREQRRDSIKSTTVKSSVRDGWAFLKLHRSQCMTVFLLTVLLVLLIGLARQIHFPATTATSPDGTPTIAYTTLLEQVKDGNVRAVAIRNENVYILLYHDLSQVPRSGQAAVHVNDANEYAAWSGSLGLNGSLPPSIGVTVLASSHSVYANVPDAGMPLLLSTLNTAHVEVNILPPITGTAILPFLLRILPFLAVIGLVLLVWSSRNRQSAMGRGMNNLLPPTGNSTTRRVDRRAQQHGSALNTTRNSDVTRPSQSSTAMGKNSSVTTARILQPPDVTFKDVAGIDEVRQELIEVVQFLRDPEKFNRLGAHIPRGALLSGAPGTGKTLLAKAVAGEAKVPFFSMSASAFVEMYVGVGASRIRDLFKEARSVAPCVVFIDEIDAVGRKRTAHIGNSDERDQTLNQLLVELDGFDDRQTVVVLAATNRPDILDDALLRPGRFDRRITLSVPDRIGREAILRVHTRAMPLLEDVDMARLARLTTGMSGADLANLANEAALAAARRDQECVDHACFEEALERAQLGVLRPLVMSDADRRTIAFHEGGHALVAYHLPEADRVNRVTILPRGQSLGVTQFSAESDRYNYSRETLMARIAVGLGGRVAEELTFGAERITTGAENDLQVVTTLARKMVTRWGMSERLGVVFADTQEGRSVFQMSRARYLRAARASAASTRALCLDAQGNLLPDGGNPATEQIEPLDALSGTDWPANTSLQALIDSEVQRILNEGRAMARTLLTEHADQLVLLADTLLEHELLDRTQFETLLQQA